MKREALEEPFRAELRKETRFGRVRTYVSVPHYIRRLNAAFDLEWSWEILSHEIRGDEVIVKGRLTAGGIAKEAFGGKQIVVTKEGAVVSIGDDLKGAAADALKKAASMLGLGLDLYTDREPGLEELAEEPPEASASSPPPPAEPPAPASSAPSSAAPPAEAPPGAGGQRVPKASEEQLGRIFELASELSIPPQDISKRCLQVYGVSTAKLNAVQAGDIIVRLERVLRRDGAAA